VLETLFAKFKKLSGIPWQLFEVRMSSIANDELVKKIKGLINMELFERRHS
jgi:hypothetical protein